MNGPDGRWIWVELLSGRRIKITKLEPETCYEDLKWRIRLEPTWAFDTWTQHLFVPQHPDQECIMFRQIFAENDCGGTLLLVVTVTEEQALWKEDLRRQGRYKYDLLEMD